MAVQPPPYQLFNVRPTLTQSRKDAFVSAYWRRLFPGKVIRPNHYLDQIFALMSHQPEFAALLLCPYYFDHVTYSLPSRGQVRSKESCNLRLDCFDSWAGLQQEKQRAAEQLQRQHPTANRDPRLNTGIYLNRLRQLQDLHPGKGISTKQYIYLMYGVSL